MILYIQLLIKKYPDAEITTYYLGSDQNEQLFAFIRTSYAGGRSRNLDAATMAYGIEKRNVRSELSLREDTSVFAHTRRRTVMRPAVPSPMVRSCSFSSNSEVTTIAKEKQNVWTRRMIEVSKLAKFMDQASKDCIQEGKRHKFPVFMQEQEPKERTGRRIRRESGLI